MSETLLSSLRDAKRVLAEIRWGGLEGPHFFRWTCAVCGYEVSEAQELDAAAKMNDHSCMAGWCTIPAGHPSQPSSLVERFQVSPEDRERWQREREGRALARAKVKPRL